MKSLIKSFKVACTPFLLVAILQIGQAPEPPDTKTRNLDAGKALTIRQAFGFRALEHQSGYAASLEYEVPATIPESTLIAYAEYRSSSICGGLNYRWLSHTSSTEGIAADVAKRSMNISLECLWHSWQ